MADPEDTETSYVITQGSTQAGDSISLDSPAGWSFTDAIAVDLIPFFEATMTFTFVFDTFECQEQLPFTPQCESDLGESGAASPMSLRFLHTISAVASTANTGIGP